MEFPGGVIFMSTENDIRLITGLSGNIPSTLVDIGTNNLSQNIRNTLNDDSANSTIFDAVYHDYKYRVQLSNYGYNYDVRRGTWSRRQIKTDSYRSMPVCFGIFNNVLYNGQDDGIIEREYASVKYKSEDVKAFLETPHIAVRDDYKFVRHIILWMKGSVDNEIDVEIITDDNTSHSIEVDTNVDASSFDSTYFSDVFYDSGINEEDYRVVHINRQSRWIKVLIKNETGRLFFRGLKIVVDGQNNSERRS